VGYSALSCMQKLTGSCHDGLEQEVTGGASDLAPSSSKGI